MLRGVWSSRCAGKTLFVTLGRDDAGTRVRNGEGGGAQGRDNRDNGKGRDGRKGGKGRDGEGGEGKKRTLLEVVTPLFETPYEQQVADKAKTIKTQCVDKMLREIKHAYRTKIKQRHQGGGKYVPRPFPKKARRAEACLAS